jgi:single-strand DNA-binding protein
MAPSSATKTSDRIAVPEPAASSGADPLNEVHLRGKVSGAPQPRELPSGDCVVMLRLVVPRTGRSRPRAASAAKSTDGRTRSAGVDTLDCAVWRADLRRRVATWGDGDRVEISGSLHRRFWRAGGGVASRYEVEVSSVRRLGRLGR